MKRSSEAILSEALNFLPYLLAKGEVSLSQAANDLRLTGDQVNRLVRLLQFCGVPPYGGGDTFECYVQQGTIHLEVARGAPKRPARLTLFEGLALGIGAHLAERLVPSAAGIAGRLAEKLALAASSTREVDLALEVGGEPEVRAEWPSLLRSAISDRKAVQMSYYSASSARLSERVVEPYSLSYFHGRWYLLAYCRLRRRQTVFRLDRIREASATSENFARRSSRMREPTPSYESPVLEVDILLPEAEARSLEERESPFLKGVEYGLPERMARVHVVSDSLPWVVSFVLKYAGQAVLEGPQHVREAVVRAAREILERYSEAKEATEDRT